MSNSNIKFTATFYDSENQFIDINAENGTLTIIDHSNYDGESGTAQSGGSNTITLASDATGDSSNYYNDLYVYLTGGTGSGQVIKVLSGGYNPTTKVLTVSSSWSGTPDSTTTYQICQWGQVKSLFFSKIIEIVDANGDKTTYKSLDGDLSYPAAVSLPITDTFNYTTGDGVYSVNLYTVPEFVSTGGSYKKDDCVRDLNGDYYKALADNPGTTQPASDPANWQKLSSYTDVTSRYKDLRTFVVLYDIKKGFVKLIYQARCGINSPCDVDKVVVSQKYKDAMMLDMIILSATELINKQDWDMITHDINLGKKIISANE